MDIGKADAKARRVLQAVQELAWRCDLQMLKVLLKWDCPMAAKAHRDNSRFYAHSFHFPGTVCVVPEIAELPLPKLAGVLVHEVGHVCCDKKGAVAEPSADEWVRQNLGLTILYDARDTVEYLSDDDLRRLRLV